MEQEAAGGADSSHGDSLATSAGQGRGEGDKTNQLQLFWICRDVVKEGWSLKEAVQGNEGCGL